MFRKQRAKTPKLDISNFIGDVPLYKTGSAKGLINRALIAKEFSITTDKVCQLYNNWKDRFHLQPDSTLTFKEFLDKINEAGISPYQIGCGSHSYQLARYTDEGPYTKESCRFVPRRINDKEKVVNGKAAGKQLNAIHLEVMIRASIKARTCVYCGRVYRSKQLLDKCSCHI